MACTTPAAPLGHCRAAARRSIPEPREFRRSIRWARFNARPCGRFSAVLARRRGIEPAAACAPLIRSRRQSDEIKHRRIKDLCCSSARLLKSGPAATTVSYCAGWVFRPAGKAEGSTRRP